MDIDITDIVRNYLLRYSEWLDADQHLIRGSSTEDKRTHSELVDEFLKEAR